MGAQAEQADEREELGEAEIGDIKRELQEKAKVRGSLEEGSGRMEERRERSVGIQACRHKGFLSYKGKGGQVFHIFRGDWAATQAKGQAGVGTICVFSALSAPPEGDQRRA